MQKITSVCENHEHECKTKRRDFRDGLDLKSVMADYIVAASKFRKKNQIFSHIIFSKIWFVAWYQLCGICLVAFVLLHTRSAPFHLWCTFRPGPPGIAHRWFARMCTVVSMLRRLDDNIQYIACFLLLSPVFLFPSTWVWRVSNLQAMPFHGHN